MYSTNINQQQDGRHQAPPHNIKSDPNGGKYAIILEDVTTADGNRGLDINIKTIRRTNHKTPASHVTGLLDTVIRNNMDIIGEVMSDVINRNREDKR